MAQLKTIAFDADDTLWVNEPIFTNTRLRFEELLSHYLNIDENLESELYEVEKRNLKLFGYGIKGFILSMIESGLELTGYELSGKDIQSIIDLGKEMLIHPIEVLPGIQETLEALKSSYQLMIITKGDLWDQENKIARSGLADHFDIVEIVSEKDAKTYRELLERNQVKIEEFLMIGNSLKSDILPICELGGRAIHVPFHDTWTHEQVNTVENTREKYVEITVITETLQIITSI